MNSPLDPGISATGSFLPPDPLQTSLELSSSQGSSSANLVDQALQSAETQLRTFASDPAFTTKMNLAFGTDFDLNAANDFAQSWLSGNFSALPTIEIRSGAEINEADGAFAAQTNRIYLSSDFLSNNAKNPDAVTAVLLEEIGHAIDFRINKTDAAGDEGDIFSRLVRGEQISASELLELKAEDDHAVISLNGQSLKIEMSQIAIISFGSKLLQTVRGMDNQVYTRSSTNGTDWGSWAKTDDAWTESAPATASFNNKLYQSVRGTNDLVYIRSSTNGINWSTWTADPSGGTTSNAPAMAVLGNKLYQSVKGKDNHIYTRSSSDGQNWSKWGEGTSGGTTSSTPSMAVLNGNLYQTVRGMDNHIYTRFSSDGKNWSKWEEGSLGGTTSSAPSTTVLNGKLYQAVRGLSDDRIYIRSTSDGKTWSSWGTIGATTDVTPSAPAITVHDGKLYLSVQGMDNRVYTRSSSNGTTWGNWNVSGQTELTPTEIPDLLAKPMNSPNSAQQYNTWHATYFNNSNLSGAPVLGGMIAKIDYDWGTGSPPSINQDNFSARYEGIFQFDAGNYTFKPSVDDGMRIWIDGQLVRDFWNSRTGSNFDFKHDVTAGLHSIKVEYHELGGNAYAKFSWDKIISPPGLMSAPDNLSKLVSGSSDLLGKTIGNGECVTFVNNVTNNPTPVTTNWKQGENVIANGNVSVGTAIATFLGPNNAYDTPGNANQHTAIFAGYTYGANGQINGFNVWDQNWNWARVVKYHSISISGQSRTTSDADSYYVLQV